MMRSLEISKEKKCFSERMKVKIHEAVAAAYHPRLKLVVIHHFPGFPGEAELIRFRSNGVPFSVLTHFSKEVFILEVFYGETPGEYYKVFGGEKWSVDNSRHSRPWILRFEHRKGKEVWLDTSIPLQHERHEEMGNVIERIKKDIINIRRSIIGR